MRFGPLRLPSAQSLQGRIALTFIALMLVTQLGGSVVLRLVGGASAREQAHQEMLTAGRVASEVLRTRDQQLQLAAAVLAADFGFRAAMATGDRETIESALQNSAQRIHADMALLFDVQGRPQVSFPDLGPQALALTGQALAERPASASGFSVVSVGPRLFQVVVVPVRAPEQIGSVMLGFELGHSVAGLIREMTGAEVTLLQIDAQGYARPATSTLPKDHAQRLADRLSAVADDRPDEREIDFGSGLFLASVQTLARDIGGGSQIRLVLDRSVDAELEPFWTLWERLQLYSLLMLMLATLLSLWLARGIAAPLRTISQFARRLAAGHYEALPPVSRRDEVGDLADAFEHMRQGIAERERHISHLAYHDPLTGLSNRSALQACISERIAAQPGKPFAVYLLDLDRFKFVNEVLGHAVGDKVLCEVGRRLHSLDQYGTLAVARLGGDEFAMLAPCEQISSALSLGEHIVELLHVPIVVDDCEVDACASVGITIYPQHGEDSLTLLRFADMAMYHAKERKGGVAVFDPAFARSNSSCLNLLSELRRAVENNELVLHFQPKIDLSGSGKRAVEALVRWNHPEQGFMPPMNFIPFAEQTGFIRDITQWVLRESMRACVDWSRRGLRLQVAVNISARDMIKPELVDEFRALLQETGCAAEAILLEVTETALADDPELALRNLQAFRAMGCDLAIDDYGSGYSSLAYLERLPVTELKIDKGFVLNMLKSASDESIVHSTIDLAHRLGLRVTAEGVDSLEALQRLQSFGCDTAQGFFLCRPVAASVVEAWYREGADRQHLRSSVASRALTTP